MHHRPQTTLRSKLQIVAALMASVYGLTLSAETQSFEVRDTLHIEADADEQAQASLDAIAWAPTTFRATAEMFSGHDANMLIRFPSPIQSDEQALNHVIVEGYLVKDDAGEVVEAPAMVLLHSLHPHLLPSRSTARLLRKHGIHAFIVQLPGYQQRSLAGRSSSVIMVGHAGQAIADARRTADVIRSLDMVKGKLGLLGISMGGFVASPAAALDDAYDAVFILLSGYSGSETILTGEQDAKRLRQRLLARGWSLQDIRDALYHYEPQRLAHRLNPQRTWMVSAEMDRVASPEQARKLAEAANLPDNHHRWLAADHYTAAVYLPAVVEWISSIMHDEPKVFDDVKP